MGNHKEWRKLTKKQRRKRIRQKLAKERDDEEAQEEAKRLASPTYQRHLQQQHEDEEFLQTEEIRLSEDAHKNWVRIEREAQRQWLELQKRLELVRNERTKQLALIKEEWDREQEKLKKIRLEKENALKEQLKQEQELQTSIESYIQHSSNTLPPQLLTAHATNPGKAMCPFYAKTAACRFRNTCSRNHVKPTVSPVLIIRNFYTHYSLDRTAENEHGADAGLEFELSEVYEHFKEFFHDVLTEMEKLGRVHQFKVCSNRDAHLRGNVYVEYDNCREAILSYRTFHGRYYAGKQITVEFCNIPSWKGAICGLFARKKCPKGEHCNFLHPFRNPGDIFRNADSDKHRFNNNNRRNKATNDDNDSTSGKNWRWSESPERSNSTESSEWDDRSSRSRRESTKDTSSRENSKRKTREIKSSRKRKEGSRSPKSSRSRERISKKSKHKSKNLD